MSSPLFGTDGIRGVANRDPITPRLALELGLLVGELFRQIGDTERPRVLIGRDTRLSGPMLEAALTAGLLSAGADVSSLGVVPTPAVAHLTRTLGAAAGVVISASHNPFADNGLKIFQGNGLKCDDALEARIEAALQCRLGPNPKPTPPGPEGGALGRLVPLDDAAARYQEAVLATWPRQLPDLTGLRIAVDAANGAAFRTTPAVLRALGAEVLLFHDAPDGVNINQACGSTHPEVIERLVRETGADFGLSHDGDADRVVCCDETGSALDGDEFLAIVGLHLLGRGELAGNAMVATVMSNLALDELFIRHGGSVRRAAVGDRAVLEEMARHGLDFGGEQSGHFLFRRHATTGDGLLSALQLLRVMRETGRPLGALRRVLEKYPQQLINLPVRERVPFADLPAVAEAVRGVEAELGGFGRVLLRYSGTEPKARLLIEAPAAYAAALPALAERILAPLRAAVGLLVLLLFLFLLPPAAARATVSLGIDVLEQDNFALLQGKRVGLVTNQTGVDGQGRRTRAVLRDAPGVKLVKLFAPEHGIDGTVLAGKYVKSQHDDVTGLDVYSLYDATRKPTPEMLRGLDYLLFDMQDIGVRSYTYVSTMVKCMEAAGENGVPFVVLDRPNPIGGRRVEGPGVEPRWISFVGQIPVPYVHGCTVGELARMINDLGWNGAKCRLVIVPMRGWTRDMTWAETGLRWVRTSPNIPYADSPLYYVATGMAGGLSGLNIGIGTAEPFQIVAAPGFPAAALAARIEAIPMNGVTASPFYDPAIGWQGIRLKIDPHAPANLCALALLLLSETNRSAHLFDHSTGMERQLFYKVYGSETIRDELESGHSLGGIVASWQPAIDRFKEERSRYLLY